MAIIVTCECGKQFQTGDENAGRRARCPDCGREIILKKAGSLDLDLPEPVDIGETATTNGKSIASLILGLTSLFCCLNIITGIPAIVLGVIGSKEITASNGRLKGSGMATSGIVFGILGCILTLLLPLLVLPALLLPAVQSAREAARRAQCSNNLKQIGLAMANYESANDVFVPPAITDKQGKPLLSWRVAILPYLDQSGLFNRFHLDEPWDSPHNMSLLAEMPDTYRCPSDATTDRTLTNYQVFVGPHTMFEEGKPIPLRSVTDGTSNTLEVIESRASVPWTKPEDISFAQGKPIELSKTFHPGGRNALFVDGSVRFLKTSLPEQIFRALITRDGGEIVNSRDW